MSEQAPITGMPDKWLIAQEYDPNAHLMQFERYDKKTQKKVVTDYLNVQNRLVWFIRDQRAIFLAGRATTSYLIDTQLVSERDNWAEFRTTVRDCMGNQCTMYGSEDRSDFPDYREKASTKSLGRALAGIGYGTQFAPELSDGEEDRPVDAPQERRNQSAPARPQAAAPQRPVSTQAAPTRPATGNVQTTGEAPATERQITSIRKLCAALGRPEPDVATLTFAAARELLTSLSQAYSEARQAS